MANSKYKFHTGTQTGAEASTEAETVGAGVETLQTSDTSKKEEEEKKEEKKEKENEMGFTVFARIPFRYGGQELERGELFTPKGLPRDGQLLGLGYYLPYDKREHHDIPCDSCGKHFISDAFFITHKKKPGGCLAPSPEINRQETAMLLDIDPKKLVLEDV